jgi:hypothetical protein
MKAYKEEPAAQSRFFFVNSNDPARLLFVEERHFLRSGTWKKIF